MSGRDNILVVGTRGSLLARAQTQQVVDLIQARHPHLQIQIEIISTAGDRDQISALPEIGNKGLFTTELEKALLDGSIDLAIHSAKDLPSELTAGSEILAYPPREDPRDAWVAKDKIPFDEVEPGSVIGTSSLRRQAQLLMRRRDLQFVTLRGNVDTRIRKVRAGECAGAVLAMAGLIRSGLIEHVTHPFEPVVCLPAPGQGALALQGRSGDKRVQIYLKEVHHEATGIAVTCERAILARLDAGCRAPVAIFVHLESDLLHAEALVADPRGRECVRAAATASAKEPRKVVDQVVDELLADGAAAIIAACRQ